MTETEMKAAARAEAMLFGDVDCTPVINGELDGIMARHRRAKIHAISTAYVYGDIVQLSTRNGHRYRCTQGGTSASTEPTFPLWDSSSISDGTCIWIEAGPDYDNVYDVRAILHDCWMLKASKATPLVTNSNGNRRIEASSLQSQCRARAMDYAPLECA